MTPEFGTKPIRIRVSALGVGTVILLGALVVACTTRSPGRELDDDAIKAALKAKLASDVRLSELGNSNVNIADGIVTLTGSVPNERDRLEYETKARSVSGVREVKNNLHLLRQKECSRQTCDCARPGTCEPACTCK